MRPAVRQEFPDRLTENVSCPKIIIFFASMPSTEAIGHYDPTPHLTPVVACHESTSTILPDEGRGMIDDRAPRGTRDARESRERPGVSRRDARGFPALVRHVSRP